MSYNPNVGAPGVRPVGASPYRSDSDCDLPRTYTEARDAFERADKRRGRARGKVAHNTYLERFLRPGDLEAVYAVRLHRTRIVQFHPDGSIVLDTGGWQTPTTRDRMNRCGLNVYMSSGVAIVRHGGTEHVYRDGMRLHPDGSVSGPPVVGSAADVVSRRKRHLAAARRAKLAGQTRPFVVFYWPTRRGGETHFKGNVPEAFSSDSDLGLKPRTRASIEAQTPSNRRL